MVSAHLPRISVVICAYADDRWEQLGDAISSILAQTPPPDEVIVVVDHNDPLCERLAAADLGIRVLPNTRSRGLSGARNTGIAVASGDLIAFLDDDAIATPGWLPTVTAPFADPRVAATGGRIEPSWATRRPEWFPEELDWVVGCTYRGLPERRADVRNVIGAGMAFRRSALDAVGGFDAALGRGTGLPVGGEETELCIRIRRHDPTARVVYEPAAIVRHHVPAARATRRYLVRRAWAEGLTKARLARVASVTEGLATERGYVRRVLPAAIWSAVTEAVRRRRSGVLLRAIAIAVALLAAGAAYVLESIRLRFGDVAAGVRPREARPLRRRGSPSPAGDPSSRPLRILQVTPRFAPFVGGVETHTEEVARRLAARGHDVTVATTDPDGGLPPTERRDGVLIRRVSAWPRHRDWHFAPGLLPIIRGGDWDVVHLQGVHTLVPPMGAVGAALARRPFVLTFHSGGHSSRVRTAARGLQWRLIAPFVRRAAALVGVSRFEVERFASELALPRDRFALIRNGAEAAPPADPGTAATTTSSTDASLILSLGRLERYKGHQRIVAAMPAILHRIPSAHLRVAGSGPYEDELRRLVAELGLQDTVTIGAVPRHEVPAIIGEAALVVLLSEYEAHPVAVMEAVAARRRVLVADTTGFRELAEDGLVRAIPIDSPAERIAAAAVDEICRPPLETAPTLPTWDDTTDELERLYRRVVSAT